MKQQPAATNLHLALAAVILVGLLMAFSVTPASAIGLTVDTTTSGAGSGDWLEVLVGFGMLLVIGLGGLWFSQHQMKFR